MAFDIKTFKWLNESKQGNFVLTPIGNVCNVQIFSKINMESTCEMVGQLAQIISQLPVHKPIETTSTKIVSPYDISPDVFVFDVAINSGGGDVLAARGIASMFALAKSRGAIIRTHTVGQASSAASTLAVMGTPGYRIISEDAYHFVHYGNASISGSRENELEIATQNTKKDREQIFSIYEKE